VPSPYLASFGSPVRFWQNERNFAAAFVEAATWVAGDWTEHAVSATGRPLHLSVSNQGDELWR
jgi:hypothetical protein